MVLPTLSACVHVSKCITAKTIHNHGLRQDLSVQCEHVGVQLDAGVEIFAVAEMWRRICVRGRTSHGISGERQRRNECLQVLLLQYWPEQAHWETK